MQNWVKAYLGLLSIIVGLGVWYWVSGKGVYHPEPPLIVYLPTPDPATNRIIYPNSVVPGGVFDGKEASKAKTDPLVAEHYAKIDPNKLVTIKAATDQSWYVSYRKDAKIYWTGKPVLVRQGERILVQDGLPVVRGRCGNRLSKTPQTPTLPPSDEPELDTPIARTPPSTSKTPGRETPFEIARTFDPLPNTIPGPVTVPGTIPGVPPVVAPPIGPRGPGGVPGGSGGGGIFIPPIDPFFPIFIIPPTGTTPPTTPTIPTTPTNPTGPIIPTTPVLPPTGPIYPPITIPPGPIDPFTPIWPPITTPPITLPPICCIVINPNPPIWPPITFPPVTTPPTNPPGEPPIDIPPVIPPIDLPPGTNPPTVVTPEPASGWLLGMALLGLVIVVRNRLS